MSFLTSSNTTFIPIAAMTSASLKVKVAQLCLTLCPMDYTVHGILQARILEWVAFPFSRGSSQPKDQTQVSHISGRFCTAKPQGKAKTTGVGSLSLLQWIFLTEELNRGLLHCRQILYRLSWKEHQQLITHIHLYMKNDVI